MIIVSQDKDKIINHDNVPFLWINKNILNETIKTFYIYADHDFLGEYKTKERAKEVLQEIVKATIETRKSQELNNLFGGAGIIPSNTYYEMPED